MATAGTLLLNRMGPVPASLAGSPHAAMKLYTPPVCCRHHSATAVESSHYTFVAASQRDSSIEALTEYHVAVAAPH